MSFFKRYNGTMNKRLARLEKLIWTLIYGGLLSGLIGWFMHDRGDTGGLWLIVIGGIVALAGFMLILVRARLNEGSNDSGQPPTGKRPS